jgi:Matrixin
MNKTNTVLCALFLIACSQESKRSMSVCNDMLNACSTSANAGYCTFGFKFGDQNPFLPAGVSIPGPMQKAIEISYKFQRAGLTFNTHSKDGIVSVDFLEADKEGIRLKLAKWQSVANISFTEKLANDKTDITIILATIEQGGIGYPAFVAEPCKQLSGFLILSTRNGDKSKLSLHEIGHVLGLGHVSSNNVMNPDRSYDDLQPGDIAGVQSIYGVK